MIEKKIVVLEFLLLTLILELHVPVFPYFLLSNSHSFSRKKNIAGDAICSWEMQPGRNASYPHFSKA